MKSMRDSLIYNSKLMIAVCLLALPTSWQPANAADATTPPAVSPAAGLSANKASTTTTSKESVNKKVAGVVARDLLLRMTCVTTLNNETKVLSSYSDAQQAYAWSLATEGNKQNLVFGSPTDPTQEDWCGSLQIDGTLDNQLISKMIPYLIKPMNELAAGKKATEVNVAPFIAAYKQYTKNNPLVTQPSTLNNPVLVGIIKQRNVQVIAYWKRAMEESGAASGQNSGDDTGNGAGSGDSLFPGGAGGSAATANQNGGNGGDQGKGNGNDNGGAGGGAAAGGDGGGNNSGAGIGGGAGGGMSGGMSGGGSSSNSATGDTIGGGNNGSNSTTSSGTSTTSGSNNGTTTGTGIAGSTTCDPTENPLGCLTSNTNTNGGTGGNTNGNGLGPGGTTCDPTQDPSCAYTPPDSSTTTGGNSTAIPNENCTVYQASSDGTLVPVTITVTSPSDEEKCMEGRGVDLANETQQEVSLFVGPSPGYTYKALIPASQQFCYTVQLFQPLDYLGMLYGADTGFNGYLPWIPQTRCYNTAVTDAITVPDLVLDQNGNIISDTDQSMTVNLDTLRANCMASTPELCAQSEGLWNRAISKLGSQYTVQQPGTTTPPSQ